VNWEGAAFRNVMECATAERQTEPIEGHEYAFGVDWGRKVDATAVAIVDLTSRACVAMERWAGVPYPVQQDRVKVLNDHWRPKTIIGEENSMGGPIVEALQRAGMPVKAFNTNNASKANAIEALGLAFERYDLAIIPDPVLLSELQAYQAVRLPSGMTRYSAPAGLHDDTVMALAMAYEALGKAKKIGRLVIGGLVRPSAWGNMAGR
jgi:phage FluMu gp28-like protein